MNCISPIHRLVSKVEIARLSISIIGFIIARFHTRTNLHKFSQRSYLLGGRVVSPNIDEVLSSLEIIIGNKILARLESSERCAPCLLGSDPLR